MSYQLPRYKSPPLCLRFAALYFFFYLLRIFCNFLLLVFGVCRHYYFIIIIYNSQWDSQSKQIIWYMKIIIFCSNHLFLIVFFFLRAAHCSTIKIMCVFENWESHLCSYFFLSSHIPNTLIHLSILVVFILLLLHLIITDIYVLENFWFFIHNFSSKNKIK